MAAAKLEDLAVGGLLPNYGVRRNTPHQWITRYSARVIRQSLGRRTIRSARSPIAPNVPHADLYATQPHGLFIDDVLVSAGSLIDEMTITLYAARELNELEFFHIKLDSHDVIHAEE